MGCAWIRLLNSGSSSGHRSTAPSIYRRTAGGGEVSFCKNRIGLSLRAPRWNCFRDIASCAATSAAVSCGSDRPPASDRSYPTSLRVRQEVSLVVDEPATVPRARGSEKAVRDIFDD